MVDISLCMIVKNEEEILARCLKSAQDFVEEIIVVDTGSTDRTIEIAKKFGAKVYLYQWQNHFAEARNYAFEQATKSYQMWMDADEYFNEEERELFRTFKERLSLSADMVMMPTYMYCEKGEGITCSFWRERIIKRTLLAKWEGRVHEAIKPQGIIVYWDIPIIHEQRVNRDVKRNLVIYEQILQTKNAWCNRDQFYYIRELYDNEFYESALLEGEHFLSRDEGTPIENVETKLVMAYCKKAMGKSVRSVLYSCFKDLPPRRDICCEIAESFYKENNLTETLFWYTLALSCPIEGNYLFVNELYRYDKPYKGIICAYEALEDQEMVTYYREEWEKVKYERLSYEEY